MDAEAVLRIVLYLVLIALAGTGIWALRNLVATARSTGALADELHRDLPPLISKANTTLDSVNAEIGKVDDIVSQIEEVSDRVGATTRAAEEVIGAPVAAVMGMGGRVRRIASIMTGKRL